MLKEANELVNIIGLRTSVWCDFGFLLKVTRNHGTLSGFNINDDVDIGVLYYTNLQDDIKTYIANLDAECTMIYIDNKLTMIKIAPKTKGLMAIDVSVYYERIPGVFETYMIFRNGWGAKCFYNYLTRFLLIPFYCINITRKFKWPNYIKDTFFFNAIFKVALIQVCAATVVPTVYRKVDGIPFKFPAQTDAYLNGRYGDWCTVREKWVFNRDQNDLVEISVKQAANILSRACCE